MKFIKLTLLVLSLIGVSSSSILAAHKADYIVVGAGTAGGLMAKKLSDDKNTSVVVIHAGTNESETSLFKFSTNSSVTVPGALSGPPFAEIGSGVPQVNADNRSLEWVLSLPEGGASQLNAGAYCRATNQLNEKWEKIAGPKWSVERILKIYKKLEKYDGVTHNPSSRGFHGPLSVRQVPHPTEVAKKFTKGMIRATDFHFVRDYNDPKTPIGISSQLQYTQSGHTGKYRVSSATAFLNEHVVTEKGHGVDGRKLRILFNSMALRTIWKGNKAIGVEYSNNGKTKRVFAKKGVVVCAGLRSSPFLMHSGVGPQSLLESLNIPVIYNNPNVGQGLADQPTLRMVFSSNPQDYSAYPNGLFSQIAWLPTPGGNKKIRTLRFATATQLPGVTLLLLDLCQPKSRGFVTINSNDPTSAPVVDLNVLSNSDDLTTFRKGLQIYTKNINEEMQKIDPTYELTFPDPVILDDAALVDDFIRENVASNQHFQSHCRMASRKRGGVVNSRGRVYGTKRLYVADDSVVPLVMDGSPMASAYLIAANIADMLIEGS